MLVTERGGRLRIVRDFTLDPQPVSGIPPVLETPFQGLWDVALHPRFADNRLGLLHLCETEPGRAGRP